MNVGLVVGKFYPPHKGHKGDRDDRVDAIGARAKVDLYLHTAPDVAFVQDGFRDGERIRDWMDRRFTEQLQGGATPVVRIDGPYDRRFGQAVAAVVELLRD